MGILWKNQKETPEIKKKKVTEMKSASRFRSRLGIAEERLSVLETVSEDSSKTQN